MVSKVAASKVGRKVAVKTISAGDRRNVVALPMVHSRRAKGKRSGHAHNAHPEISERRAFERKED